MTIPMESGDFQRAKDLPPRGQPGQLNMNKGARNPRKKMPGGKCFLTARPHTTLRAGDCSLYPTKPLTYLYKRWKRDTQVNKNDEKVPCPLNVGAIRDRSRMCSFWKPWQFEQLKQRSKCTESDLGRGLS